MSDLISRQKILAKLEIWQGMDGYSDGERNMLACCIQLIQDEPSVQPQTSTISIGRTKGETIMWYECDACGEPIDIKDNFCRNCGRQLMKDG